MILKTMVNHTYTHMRARTTEPFIKVKVKVYIKDQSDRDVRDRDETLTGLEYVGEMSPGRATERHGGAYGGGDRGAPRGGGGGGGRRVVRGRTDVATCCEGEREWR